LDATRADDASFVLHELAHCLTGLRSLPNYGLGGDPGGGADTPCVVTESERASYENLALIATVALMKDFGCSDVAIKHYVGSYGFEYWAPPERWGVWETLKESHPHVTAKLTDEELRRLMAL